jgi:diadenosine tetraphosphate (Ap4A) HIT family hydrolase
VVWQAHVREMSDLTVADRRRLLDVVAGVEAAVRVVVRPDKINLASLGNVVPHLHWHVIPRWADDSHFPAPIWAAAARPAPPRARPDNTVLIAALAAQLGESR